MRQNDNSRQINLVIQTAFLGDLLLTVPLLAWIKKIDPQRPLGLVCRKGLGTVFQKLGLVDEVWEIEKGNSKTYQVAREKINRLGVRFLVSPHTSVRTTLFCARIRAQNKITFAKPWNFLVFGQRVQRPHLYPEALRLLSLIINLSEELKSFWRELPEPEFYWTKSERGELPPAPDWADPHRSLSSTVIEKLYSELQIGTRFQASHFVALFPGSVWATKMWKIEKYIELAKTLQNLGYQILVMGGAEEKSLGDQVVEAVPGVVNLCGKSAILESLLILSRAHLVIGNDSSSSHMAALMGVPVVSVFGPTVLRFGYRPWGKRVQIFERDDLECRPCGPHGHKKCPLGHHRCMDLNLPVSLLHGISPESGR